MAKRGGLGRGLDALIPDRSGKQKKAEQTRKTELKIKKPQKKVSEEASEEVISEEESLEENEEDSSYNPFELVLDDSSSDEYEEDSDENFDYGDTVEEDEENELEEGDSDESFEEKKEPYTSEDDNEDLQEEISSQEETSGSEDKPEHEDNEEIASKSDLAERPEGYEKEKSPESSPEIHKESVVSLKLSQVEPNRDQPRKYFDDETIEELADSIRQFGIISPLLVQRKDGYYEIIAGERRWRAAQKAGLREVPVIVKDFTSQEAVEVSLIENIQREDLNPIEEAKAYDRLLSEYGLNQEEIAGRVSKSRSAVANSMRLLKLDSDVQKLVETGSLTEGHARALLGITDPEMQKKTAQEVIDQKLSVRQTEKLVKALAKPAAPKKREKDAEREAQLTGLAEKLKTTLGTKVSIHQNGNNKGKIEIEYYSDDELERIYALLQSVR